MALDDWLALFVFPWSGSWLSGLGAANDLLGTDVTFPELIAEVGDGTGLTIDFTGLSTGLETLGGGLMVVGAALIVLIVLIASEDS